MISGDIASLFGLVLVAVICAGIGGIWTVTALRARSQRRNVTDLTERVRRATVRNRTAVLVTIAGLVVMTFVLAWYLVAVLL